MEVGQKNGQLVLGVFGICRREGLGISVDGLVVLALIPPCVAAIDVLRRSFGAQAGRKGEAADKEHDQKTTHGLVPFGYMFGRAESGIIRSSIVVAVPRLTTLPVLRRDRPIGISRTRVSPRPVERSRRWPMPSW